MSYNEDKVDEAALALMHLVKHRHRQGPLRAWKGLDWDILDRLHEKGYISDPKSKAKSVVMTEEGAEKSAALFEELFVDESAEVEREEEGDLARETDDGQVIDPRWREGDWPAPSSVDELQVVRLTEAQMNRLASGLNDDPDTVYLDAVYLDAEAGEVDSFYEPGPYGDVGLGLEEEAELREEARQRREELESDDRYFVIPKEETGDAWQRMKDFIAFVTEDAFRELLENAVHGKGAFRRFKDALCRREGARDRWFDYESYRRNHKIRDFLAARGYRVEIVAADEA